jgi:hypothetical protein
MCLLYLRDDPEIAAATAAEQTTLFAREATQASAAGPTDSAARQGPNVDPAAVLGDVSDDELIGWAGKPLFRKAQKGLGVHGVEIETTPALVVRFPGRNITCRWIPSGGLLGMVCSCRAETVCEHVVAAVLAYQASLGRRTITFETTALAESSGAPRTRAEVLQSVSAVLREMTALGLARVSAAARQRLTTLAVSAHGVDLPRLERMLKALADEIDLALKRDAQAALPGLFWQAARVEAVCTALTQKPSPALVGVHRTQYHDVGQITLVGLGAHRWRSKGGYHGLTLFFWDESRGAWGTWSESRPVAQAGFDPAARFRADGPWIGCNSPQSAAVSVLRLTGAWRNAQGRISGRPSTRALVVGPSLGPGVGPGVGPGAGPNSVGPNADNAVVPNVDKPAPQHGPKAIVEWSALTERIQKLFGGGLAERIEHEELVLLEPKAWGPAFYDPLRQELTRPILDARGRTLELWLPFNAENEKGVELLEKHDPTGTRGVLGALRWGAGGVRVQPISLLEADRIVHLNLEGTGKPNPPTTTGAPGSAKTGDGEAEEILGADVEEEDELDDGATPAIASGLSRLLATAEAELEAMAERGLGVRRDLAPVAGVARRLQQLGFTACAKSLGRLTEVAESRSTEGEARTTASAALLRAYYVVRLAAEQEAVSLACGQLGS